MLNIPEYKEYSGETKIALMDNSSLAFMYREGTLTLENVRQLRLDDRKLTYTRQQADKSIICRKEVITKEQFVELIQDATVQILF